MTKIFNYANDSLRSGDVFAALVLYDHLMHVNPEFPYYKYWFTYCALKIQRQLGQPPNLRNKFLNARAKKVRLLDTLIACGYPRGPILHEISLLPDTDDSLALHVNLAAGNDPVLWLSALNKLFAFYKMRPIFLQSPTFAPSVFQHMSWSQRSRETNLTSLVSVCISAHNAGNTLGYAINSVLTQDYPNFEIIVIDDASQDSTRAVIHEYCNKDSRITALHNDTNMGTYFNRNKALAAARGEYFTVLDADDICHPERLLDQVRFLETNPGATAVVTHWLRIDHEGRLIYRNPSGGIVHEGIATTLFRREQVTTRIGYYDTVRFSADTEYVERIKRVFGQAAVGYLKKPLTLALSHQDSLTSNAQTGIHNYLGMSPIRQRYRNAWKQWHATTSPEKLFLPLADEASARPFPAPQEMTLIK